MSSHHLTSLYLDELPPSNFINKLIMIGHASFLSSDPDGLFVKWYERLITFLNGVFIM